MPPIEDEASCREIRWSSAQHFWFDILGYSIRNKLNLCKALSLIRQTRQTLDIINHAHNNRLSCLCYAMSCLLCLGFVLSSVCLYLLKIISSIYFQQLVVLCNSCNVNYELCKTLKTLGEAYIAAYELGGTINP